MGAGSSSTVEGSASPLRPQGRQQAVPSGAISSVSHGSSGGGGHPPNQSRSPYSRDKSGSDSRLTRDSCLRVFGGNSGSADDGAH